MSRPSLELNPALAAHWRHLDRIGEATEEGVVAALQEIVDTSERRVLAKGEPDLQALKSTLARRLLDSIEHAACDAEDLGTLIVEPARTLAEFDAADARAFHVAISALRMLGLSALRAFEPQSRRYVVMHMSCVPRIQRARESVASFPETKDVAHVIVVGDASATCYRYDPDSEVLIVPAPDTYEHLPAKVMAAFAFFALCGGVEALAKVDDDHRLRDAEALSVRFAAVAEYRLPIASDPQTFCNRVRRFARRRVGQVLGRTSNSVDSEMFVRSALAPPGTPLMYGSIYRQRFPGDHLRVWHFGKTSMKGTAGERTYTYLGPDAWVTGERGYFLNRSALRALLWFGVYFRDQVHTGLFEDMLVSRFVVAGGGTLVPADMWRVSEVSSAARVVERQ